MMDWYYSIQGWVADMHEWLDTWVWGHHEGFKDHYGSEG